jgi:hypothetical protein
VAAWPCTVGSHQRDRTRGNIVHAAAADTEILTLPAASALAISAIGAQQARRLWLTTPAIDLGGVTWHPLAAFLLTIG